MAKTEFLQSAHHHHFRRQNQASSLRSSAVWQAFSVAYASDSFPHLPLPLSSYSPPFPSIPFLASCLPSFLLLLLSRSWLYQCIFFMSTREDALSRVHPDQKSPWFHYLHQWLIRVWKIQLVLASVIWRSAGGFWERFLRFSKGQKGREIVTVWGQSWHSNDGRA